MILVILGTQDKEFPRLLDAVEREIRNGNIKEKVMVQAGQTIYQTDDMEMFDLLPAPEFNKLMDEADIIITHGGVGSILTAIKKGKKIIAAARLAKYKEHHNDHQKQIIKEFADQGYLLELKDFYKLDKVLEKAKNFKPKKFESNTDNMIKLLEKYIDDTDNVSWLNKSTKIIKGLFIFAITVIVNYLVFRLCRNHNIGHYISGLIGWLSSIVVAFITFFYSYRKDHNKNIIFLITSFIYLILNAIVICFI